MEIDREVLMIQNELSKIFTHDKLINWIRKCERENAMWKFYKSKWFRPLRQEILRAQRNECQICRKAGKITKADTVHHVKHVRDYPELALTAYCKDDNGNLMINLIAICKSCHALEHPEKLPEKEKAGYTNTERW